ncbi:GxxExxY protein [Acidisphaera sp. S103]|uniref:GxxExxY protein n=1 Tax=Acidisphaera sp. S103 TaxID=1747223 RepID=UPI001C203138|nr:GxxExxY protein [Acidisphaera sp. S103]
MKGMARLRQPVTERIIGCAFQVANTLGHEFIEMIYENALACEMRKSRFDAVHSGGAVFYDSVAVGEYTTDLIVEEWVIVELKVICGLSDIHIPQYRTHPRATGKPLCLQVNFSRPRVETYRITAQA